MAGQPFTYQFPVRFSDVDHAGIVYYPRFFHYFHLAFEEFFRDRLGGGAYVSLLDDRKIGFPAVKTSADFRAPLKFGDDVRVSMRITRLGTKSVTFAYDVRRAADGVHCAAGVTVCAVTDLAQFRAIPVPDDLRRLFLEISVEP